MSKIICLEVKFRGAQFRYLFSIPKKQYVIAYFVVESSHRLLFYMGNKKGRSRQWELDKARH